jgi:hypothetical protein
MLANPTHYLDPLNKCVSWSHFESGNHTEVPHYWKKQSKKETLPSWSLHCNVENSNEKANISPRGDEC